jgi:polysaccharide export outer membrane protein
MTTVNKSKFGFLMTLILPMVISSCVSEKTMTFFRDFDQNINAREVQQADDEYLVKPNDNLYVSVKTINPEVNAMFSQNEGTMATGNQYTALVGQHIYGYQVDNNGDIILPVIGLVNVGGRTLKGAKEQIQVRADEYLKGADVQVRLLNYKVSLLGEVRSPGVFYNYNNTLTVLEAISMAGGTTDFAKLTDILVVRQTEDSVEPHRLDLTSKDILYSEAFYLKANDVVVISPQKLKNVRLNAQYYTLGISSVSAILLILNFFTN